MEVECKFKNMASNTPPLMKYFCVVKSALITKPGTKVTSVKGEHLEGKSNCDVRGVAIINSVTRYFPLGLAKIFPNLKTLIILKCGLREISSRDFIGLENLTHLSITGNILQSLPDNLFTRMTNLIHIDFCRNQLQFLNSNLLRPIINRKMVLVDFTANPSVNCRFEPKKSDTIGSLKELGEIIDANYKKPIDPVVEDFPERISRGFKDLWTSSRLSDFVIVCDSKELKVHKNVLAIQSSVLAAAVECAMQESKTGRMEIEDFSYEAVEDFLKYLYTGETPEEINAMELFALASKYNVVDLKKLMEDTILTNLDATNALEILTLGKQHNCKMIVEDAFETIQSMFPGSTLDPKLVDDLEKFKRLIDMKSEYDELLKNCCVTTR